MLEDSKRKSCQRNKILAKAKVGLPQACLSRRNHWLSSVLAEGSFVYVTFPNVAFARCD